MAAKRNTGRELHIIGREIDTYRTIWEDCKTGHLFVLLYGSKYEVNCIGLSEQLNGHGYRTFIG